MSRTRKTMSEQERTGPDRNQSGMFRDNDSFSDTPGGQTDNGGSGGNGAAGERIADEVREGLAAAYRIAEEQLEQGRQYAESLMDGAGMFGTSNNNSKMPGLNAAFAAGAGNAPQLVRQVLEFYTEISGRCLDFAFELARHPEVARYAQQFAEPAPSQPDAPSSAPAGDSGIPSLSGVEIIASVPVAVELNLYEPCDATDVYVPGMLCIDGAQTLTGVDLFANTQGQVRVRVVLAEHQLPGQYTGTVMRKSTRSPLGTLSVCVHHKA